MWRKYFKLVGLVPGPVIVQRYGTIDFSGDVPVETCKKLFEQDFRYLEITEEGKAELYGIGTPSDSPKGGEKEREKENNAGSTSSTKKTTQKKRRSSARTTSRRKTNTDS